MKKTILVIVCILTFATMAYAIPVGLNIMPTASDMNTAMMVQYVSNDAPQTYVNDESNIWGAQYANVMGFEAGIDKVSRGVGTVYNVKMQFAPKSTSFAFALGAQGIGEKSKTEYYAVASAFDITEQWPISLHAGVVTNSEDLYGVMFGAELELMKNYVVKADYVNGSRRDGSAVSIGYKQDNFIVSVMNYMPQDGDSKIVFAVTLNN